MNEHFRSPKNLAILAIVGLGLIALCEFVAAGVGAAQIASPETSIELDGMSETSLWLMIQSFIALGQIPVYITTVVLFLMWLYRAHKNLYALRPVHLQFTPGWAVGWWFIPFANLVKPYQAVREVWWESGPEINDGPTFLTASLHSAPVYMGVWWALWLSSNFLSNITGRVFDPDDMSTVVTSGYFFLLTGIVTTAAAALAIYTVRDTTQRQEMRFKEIATMLSDEPPPPPKFGNNA
jgi:hypothetical protein